ncbi:endolytic transglycosylase MltG [Gammaproteobacteria bacterium]|nr:endolytic transglycosylase MltG [Gammaproteobacteria bacterium]
MFLRKFKFIQILSLFVFLSLVVIGTTTSFSHSLISNKSTTITIEKGQSLNAVLRQLSVTSGEEFLLKAYLYTSGIDFIQAGHYELVDKTWRQFFADISNGSIKQYKFKIQEGSNLFELKKLIQSSNLNFDCAKFSCLDPGLAFHEGTLMPDTYFYKHNSPVSTILLHSQAAFIDYSQSIWKLKTSLNPLKTLDDAIILASIVEKEAGNDDEKSIIAGVFLNRLNLKMRLQADPTIIYGLLPNFNGNITKKNLKDPSNKYNTYQISGLPPTPISIVSKSSLEAVILGEPNEYLYFVAKGDGTHYFSRNYAEHLQAVRKYQLNKAL